MKTKIPVWKTAKLTIKNVWQNKLEWAHVLYAPWIVLVMGYLIVFLIGRTENLYELDNPPNPLLLQFAILFFSAFISKVQMLINGFRYALLKEGGNRWWTLHFNRRFCKLVLYYALFLCIVGLIAGGIAGSLFFTFHVIASTSTETYMLTGAGGILLALSALYLILRVSLYTLFIAIDQKRPFRSSWHLLKGNVGRFAALLGLCLVPIVMISAISALPRIVAFSHLAHFNMALELIMTLVLTPLMLALFTKGASLVYQTLDEKKTVAKTPRSKK